MLYFAIMQNADIFDILVLYSPQYAKSALDSAYSEPFPFPTGTRYERCSESYKYLLEQATERGLTAAFATLDDIAGPATVRSAWVIRSGTWSRLTQPVRARVLLNRLSPDLYDGSRVQTFLADSTVIEYGASHLRVLFDDKLQTYIEFPDIAIPTVAVSALSSAEIDAAKVELHSVTANDPRREDFSDGYVLKDRFGMGGVAVFRLEQIADLAAIAQEFPRTQFVLQPFIRCENGFTFGHLTDTMDVRLMIANQQIVHSYVRVARPGEFRCNAEQGGDVLYLALEGLPSDVIAMTSEMEKRLHVPYGTYALDFIKSSRGHLYCIEGNANPGINWFNEIDCLHTQALIREMISGMSALLRSRTL
jgi:hypothetical protein